MIIIILQKDHSKGREEGLGESGILAGVDFGTKAVKDECASDKNDNEQDKRVSGLPK